MDGRQPALTVTADGVLEGDRMALRVQANRLLARQGHLHRSKGQPREQRGLRLHGQVFLAPERAAIGHQLDVKLLFGYAEERRHLPPVVEDPLTLRVEP